VGPESISTACVFKFLSSVCICICILPIVGKQSLCKVYVFRARQRLDKHFPPAMNTRKNGIVGSGCIWVCLLIVARQRLVKETPVATKNCYRWNFYAFRIVSEKEDNYLFKGFLVLFLSQKIFPTANAILLKSHVSSCKFQTECASDLTSSGLSSSAQLHRVS
jgi:hypothetical protein